MIKSSILITILFCLPLVADMSFEEWQKQESRAFENYQTQMDREFIEILKRDWQEYQAIDTPIPYQKPKPQKQPISQPKQNPKEVIKVNPKPFKLISIPKLPQKHKLIGYDKVAFRLFSIDIEILYDKRLKYTPISISTSTIADFWNHSSSCNYRPIIKQIKEYQEVYGLDDWTTYILVQKFTKQISHNSNSQTLLNWFILLKLGIDTKIGFSSNIISLLIHTKEKLYGVSFFTLNGKKYYNFNHRDSDRLQIYRGEIDTLHAMRFLNQKIKIPFDIKNREIKFTYQNREYILNIPYNKNLINLYNTYPQLNYNRYRQISTLSRDFIVQKLLPIVSNMSETQAVNFLLRLTQNGFEYKTDNENFGKEKVMFFEETLHYTYSDCEDRAIFFAILVRELLGLDIIFVKYPNHLATAIKLKSKIGGDKIIYQNQRYYIADPTYSYANIGQAMPNLKGQKIKIIRR